MKDFSSVQEAKKDFSKSVLEYRRFAFRKRIKGGKYIFLSAVNITYLSRAWRIPTNYWFEYNY
jgi:hypothetical protein